MGKLDEAVACYRRAIELDPNSAVVFRSLGDALTALGRLAEAQQAYRKAKQLGGPAGQK
jgi:superkiller protein 3